MKELNSLTRAIAVILISYGAWSVASFARPMRKVATPQSKGTAIPRAAGLAAWQQVYSVLTSPRCINCHTATTYPQQGDDRHRHFANVIRGPEGKGVAGLNCASCHQETNADSTGVPGGHGWCLAPPSMRWQDINDQPLSSGAVCRAVTDRSKNHGLNGPGLLKHHEEEPLPTTVRLKNPTEFRLVGRPAKRLDSRPKCDGSLKFGLDLDLPGMKVAVVAHPPVFGGRVKSISDAEARRVESVLDVFEIPLVRGTGIAVVADKF